MSAEIQTLSENPNLRRWQIVVLVIGVIGLIACAVGWMVEPTQFYRSYLTAYIFWVGLAVGCLGVLMLQFVTGGRWGLILRRPLEAASLTFPLLAVLFVPILFGLPNLYVWMNAAVVAADEVLRKKQGYLNEPFFIARAIVYFVVWISIAYFLNRWSRLRQSSDDKVKYQWRLEHLGGWGMFLTAIVVSLAVIDWVMSLEPRWYSTIYAVAFVAGEMLAAFALTIMTTLIFPIPAPLAEIIGKERLRALGNLLLAFVMLWAYCAYSQYLLIWSGNLRDEITWYLPRTAGGWGWIAIGLIVLHFFLPFFLLLSRDLKDKGRTLLGIALLIFALRYVDVFWLVKPAFTPEGLSLSWLDFAAPIGLGGVWLAYFLWLFERQPLPLGEIEEEIEKEKEKEN
ncbi:MAG: hypothetical protein M3033_15455 [Acidobacteriota bacterium]|nr:hypothetical protein [Acidobacteriota bacterium]